MLHPHIIIADNPVDFGQTCVDNLRQSGFIVNTIEKDGNKLLEQIDKELPDVVIMDAYMKNLDAIGVMKCLKHKNNSKKPACIVTSSFENKFMEGEIMKQGVTYYILKPFDLSALIDRLHDLTSYLKNDGTDFSGMHSEFHQEHFKKWGSERQTEALTAKVLCSLPMTVKLKGYHYAQEAILSVIADKSLANAVTKRLYPAIAKKHNTSSSAVERAIRNAIELTWDFGNTDILNKLFGSDSTGFCAKPSNAKFIARIAEYVKITTLQATSQTN